VIHDDAFEVDPWCVRERHLDLERLAQTESVFALSNGHLGLRGNLDEGEPRALSGTYLGGFYESHPIAYGESGFGFPEAGQTVINVTDGKIIRLLVEDEPLDVHRAEVRRHERELDLRTGILTRRVHWTSQAQRSVQVTTRRLVSFRDRSVAAISYEVEAVDEPLWVALQSNLHANANAQPDGSTSAPGASDPRHSADLGAVLQSRLHVHDGLRAVLVHSTRASGLTVAAGMEHEVSCEGTPHVHTQSEDDLGRVTVSAHLSPGHPLRLVKLLAYHWSSQQSAEWLRDQVDASLESALARGFDGLAEAQREYLDAFWSDADVQVEGDGQLQQAVRFSLFSVLQATARAETRAIAAKGLTGSGYDGHAFWDTESFVLPVLIYSRPRLVRDALAWRHSTLDLARERAQSLSLSGAAFPWRTIHGEECSGYWPAGTAAFHVNADVADAVRRYVSASEDTEFERDMGLELLAETARLWCSLGFHDDQGRFRIDGVTGPDEYSALGDNNVYTNLMAQANLQAAVEAARRHRPEWERLHIDEAEIDAWRAAAEAMIVPFDERLGVHPQDEHFTSHARWDFEHTGPDDYPLLLHHPYVQLYRKQVVKQADLVLALFSHRAAFDPDQRRRDFEYYEAITVRDSSLSACVQSIVAADVGHLDLAYDYLREAALMDLDDIEHNVLDGLHIASLAGGVMAVICGLGGVRDDEGRLSFMPRLPKALQRVSFAIAFRGRRLELEVTSRHAAYRLVAGHELEIEHWGEPVTLRAQDPLQLDIPPAPKLTRPTQPPGREPRVHD
jgi:alpha,alpha-trehalose phosphorylase